MSLLRGSARYHGRLVYTLLYRRIAEGGVFGEDLLVPLLLTPPRLLECPATAIVLLLAEVVEDL